MRAGSLPGFRKAIERSLQQARLEQCPVVPDEERRSCLDGRRPQLSRTAEEHSEQLFLVGPIARQIEVKDFTSLGHTEMLDAVQDVQRRLTEDGLFRRVLDGTGLDSVLRKKLLRALTTLSSRAVVPPVDARRVIGKGGRVAQDYE
jgi:hypothetical protein